MIGEGTKGSLTARWEVEVATGKRGELLALEQTAAIWDMLAWLAATEQAGNETGESCRAFLYDG
jgi:hypothetical protein